MFRPFFPDKSIGTIQGNARVIFLSSNVGRNRPSLFGESVTKGNCVDLRYDFRVVFWVSGAL